jgi:protein-tyrosine phosphatase
MNILFVCTGNISRSFLAQNLFQKEVERLNLVNTTSLSVGLLAHPGNPPDPKMVDFLSGQGMAPKEHKARQITKAHVDWADFILVMEKEHARMIESLWPDTKGRVELLGRFVSEGMNPDDIVDPFGKSPYHYRLAQAQITTAIDGLLKELLSDRRNGPDA